MNITLCGLRRGEADARLIFQFAANAWVSAKQLSTNGGVAWIVAGWSQRQGVRLAGGGDEDILEIRPAKGKRGALHRRN